MCMIGLVVNFNFYSIVVDTFQHCWLHPPAWHAEELQELSLTALGYSKGEVKVSWNIQAPDQRLQHLL